MRTRSVFLASVSDHFRFRRLCYCLQLGQKDDAFGWSWTEWMGCRWVVLGVDEGWVGNGEEIKEMQRPWSFFVASVASVFES